MLQVHFYYGRMIAVQKNWKSPGRTAPPMQRDGGSPPCKAGRVVQAPSSDFAGESSAPEAPRRRSPLLDRVRAELRVNHYAYATEKT